MSNRKNEYFDLLVAWAILAGFLILVTLWTTWSDSKRHALTIPRVDLTLAARPIGRASFVKADSPAIKQDSLMRWEARPANNDYYIIPDSMVGKVIFPKCIWEDGDVSYLVKINDSTFVILRLPAGRVESNTEFMDQYFTRGNP